MLKRFLLVISVFFSLAHLFAQNQARSHIHFEHRFFSLGQEFLESYDSYLFSRDAAILLSAVETVQTVRDDFMQTETYAHISKESRDFRFLVQRVQTDITCIKKNIRANQSDEVPFFASDLSQTLFTLSDYRASFIEKEQQAFFSRSMRIVAYIVAFLLFLILICAV